MQFLADEEKKRQELKGCVLSDFDVKATLGEKAFPPCKISQEQGEPRLQAVGFFPSRVAG